MKAVKVTLSGQDYYLAFNAAAMFAFEDAFGGNDGYFMAAAGSDRKSSEVVCQAAAILAEQGELARRALGYDKGPFLTAETLMTCSAPADLLRLRTSVLAAITAGYGREVEDTGDVDLGLMELEKHSGKD